jgi:cytochrome oxidase Cu insertion factor (SCO1/SenC/PrrC family)
MTQDAIAREPEALYGGEYNYEHFRTKHFAADFQGTLQGRGVQPGEEAPDFELTVASGGTLRLSSLRGRPTLLHFGSPT